MFKKFGVILKKFKFLSILIMDMRIEGDVSFSYEFSPMELAVDTDDVYKRLIEICELESTEEKSQEDVTRLEELRRIKGYVGGYELDYHIEGFDFVKFGERDEIQLLAFLSPIREQDRSRQLFGSGDVYSIFKYQFEDRGREKGTFELKVHEIDDSGDEFVTEDYFYTLHPIVVSIWEPYKIERVRKVLEENPERELIELS